MAKTRLSSKGQVIIPKAVRDALDWRPGMTFDICAQGDGVLVRPSRPFSQASLDDVAGCLQWSGPPIAIEEMAAAIAKEARRRAKT